MTDLIDRAALMADIEEAVVFSGRPGQNAEVRGANKIINCIKAAPTVDAVDEKALNIVLKQEFARLYFDDEKMREHMAGYNPSCFLAGYLYALDCVMGDITLLSRERRTNAADRR